MKRNLYLTLLIIALPLLIAACSSSSIDEFEDEDSDVIAEEFEEADEVGSIPEDDQELLNEFAEGGEGDPFSELQTRNEADDAMEEMEELPSIDSDEGSMASYTVARGDTLMKIAFEFYGDVDRWRELYNWNKNKIASVYSLKPGTVLRYSTLGTWSRPVLQYKYHIQPGDTLGGIAKNIYGNVMKYKKLQRFNSRLIKDPNLIYAGFDLYYDLSPEEERNQGGRRIGETSPSSLPDTPKFPAEEEDVEPIATAVPDEESITQ